MHIYGLLTGLLFLYSEKIELIFLYSNFAVDCVWAFHPLKLFLLNEFHRKVVENDALGR